MSTYTFIVLPFFVAVQVCDATGDAMKSKSRAHEKLQEPGGCFSGNLFFYKLKRNIFFEGFYLGNICAWF